MKYFLIFSCFLFVGKSWAQTEFIKPWLDKSRPIILDVYEGNSYNIKNVKKDVRIKAIIHKMSEESADSFSKRRKEAYANGLLFGSYWLPKYDTNGANQADLHLKMIGDTACKTEFIALDFEQHK